MPLKDSGTAYWVCEREDQQDSIMDSQQLNDTGHLILSKNSSRAQVLVSGFEDDRGLRGAVVHIARVSVSTGNRSTFVSLLLAEVHAMSRSELKARATGDRGLAWRGQ